MKKLFPLVSVDIALLTVDDERLQVLLIQRANEPEMGHWALPGGVLDPRQDRSLEHTARRILGSKTGLDFRHLEQVEVFSGADRDPRGWSLSVAFYALLPGDQINAVAGEKTDSIQWADPTALEHSLAFDHERQLGAAVAKLRRKVEQQSLPLHVLPAKFTLGQLQTACEVISGKRLDKSAFRRRIREEPSLIELEGEFLRGPQRPAQLFAAADDFQF